MLTTRYLIYISILLIISLYGMITYRKHDQRFKYLILLVVFVFVSEVMTRVAAYTWRSSMPVYHFMVPVQLVLFWLVYSTKLKNTLLAILFGSAFLFSLFYSGFAQSILTFPSIQICFLSFVVILASLVDLKGLLKTSTQLKLSENPNVWFNFGNITFYSLTFFIFGLMNISIDIFPDWIYTFIFFANLILYVCYGIAIHYSRKNTTFDTFNNTD
ncbi:MAG: hypothetical protein ACFHU9_02345 [Fluviicola sp.]